VQGVGVGVRLAVALAVGDAVREGLGVAEGETVAVRLGEAVGLGLAVGSPVGSGGFTYAVGDGVGGVGTLPNATPCNRHVDTMQIHNDTHSWPRRMTRILPSFW
jgi:hypothetical protein